MTLAKPDAPAIAVIVAEYEALTADLARTPGKRRLLVGCYRVHGPALPAVVAAQFAESGTENLLGLVRCTWPGSGPFAGGLYLASAAIARPWSPEEIAAIDVPEPKPDLEPESDWVPALDQPYAEPIDLAAEARRIFDLAEEIR